MYPLHEIKGNKEHLVAGAYEKQGARVVVIVPQNTAHIALDELVAPRARRKRTVHVHVMARKVERDEELEDERKTWICGCEIAKQTRRGTSIGHHV